jgi:hypothetical protein
VNKIYSYARHPVRMWTIPVDDRVAFPTKLFYTDRPVVFSNEGTEANPRWVALDRYNDDDWLRFPYRKAELWSLYNRIKGRKEGLELSLEPVVHLEPPRPGMPFLMKAAYYLSSLVAA